MSKEEVEKKIRKALEQVNDPETRISVVDLGLIYEVSYDPQARKAYIKMTLTSPFCPLAFYIIGNVRTAVMEIEEVDDVDIELVFDPPRSPERMSEKAKKMLGIEERGVIFSDLRKGFLCRRSGSGSRARTWRAWSVQ